MLPIKEVYEEMYNLIELNEKRKRELRDKIKPNIQRIITKSKNEHMVITYELFKRTIRYSVRWYYKKDIFIYIKERKNLTREECARFLAELYSKKVIFRRIVYAKHNKLSQKGRLWRS